MAAVAVAQGTELPDMTLTRPSIRPEGHSRSSQDTILRPSKNFSTREKDVERSATIPRRSCVRPANLPLWHRRTITMALVVSLGGMIFGYVGIGQFGGFLAMQDYRDRFGDAVDVNGRKIISTQRQGALVGPLMIGALVGSLLAGTIADSCGRRRGLDLGALTCTIGQLVEITTVTAWPQIVIGRVVEGVGIGFLSILVPLYQSEVTPKEIRGAIIALYQLFITLGILLACLVNLLTKNLASTVSWKCTIFIGSILPLALFFGNRFLDESPRWDLRKKSVDRATRTIARINNTSPDHEYVKQEVQDIQLSIEAENEMARPSFGMLFRESTVPKRVLVGIVLHAMQQLTGINYFFYFGTILFAKLGIGDSFITAVILGSVNVMATVLGLWIVQYFGHRNALICGGCWIGLNLLLYSLFGHYGLGSHSKMSEATVGKAMLLFTCMAIVGFATTWGPLAWVICAEIFPFRWRAYGMGVAVATNWTFNFLIGYFTPMLTAKMHYDLGFVFAGSILFGAAFVWYFVHETAGKSLEEIDREILNGVRPWRSKKGG